MRRIAVVIACLCIAVAGLAIAQPAGAAPRTHLTKHDAVLGKKGLFAPYGSGWGSAHPRRIFNGGDPSGEADNITWSAWNGPVATGHGISYTTMPQGGYYSKPVKIILKAEHLGRCYAGGPRAYTQLAAREQVRPGSKKYTAWFKWAGLKSICARVYSY